jgi:hypothetical protein
MASKIKVSDQVRRIVETCGQTRYVIAKETSIDQSALTRFISGERGLSSEALDTLGEYLDLRVSMRTKKEEKSKGAKKSKRKK